MAVLLGRTPSLFSRIPYSTAVFSKSRIFPLIKRYQVSLPNLLVMEDCRARCAHHQSERIQVIRSESGNDRRDACAQQASPSTCAPVSTTGAQLHLQPLAQFRFTTSCFPRSAPCAPRSAPRSSRWRLRLEFRALSRSGTNPPHQIRRSARLPQRLRLPFRSISFGWRHGLGSLPIRKATSPLGGSER